MDRELVDVRVVELAGAAAADPRVELQRLRAITLVTFLARAAGLGDDSVEAGVVGIDALAGSHEPYVAGFRATGMGVSAIGF
jgi:hypothetical protein